MAWGWRSADSERVRNALLQRAAVEVAGLKTNDRTYLAALYAEQCRTNDLLEQLLTERSAGAQ